MKQLLNYHTARVANPCKPGRDVPPHTDAALSDGLTGRQLQEEQGNTHHQHYQNIQEEK